MLENCENVVLISPTTNEWPQNHNQIDEKGMNQMDSSTSKIPMEKLSAGSGQEHQQQALKCPRCDSSNTKFCYYNNYSLTQPRHFCKACKRYWTRGGTLRNVPVGGGCRRNKRIRRPSSSSSSSSRSSFSAINDHSPVPPSSSINTLLYGLPNNYPSELYHLQFSGYYDLDLDLDGHRHQQHQMSGFGLGFSSGLVSNEDYRNGFASNSLLSSYGSMFGSSPSTTTTPTMASIIASGLQQQQKFIQGGEDCEENGVASYHFKSLLPFENMQIGGSTNGENGGIGVKVEEEEQNRFGWSTNSNSTSVVPSSQIHQTGSSSDNNPSLYWNNTNWHDLTNIDSSLTSII